MWVVLAHFICLFLLTYCPPDSSTVSPPIKRHCCSETGTWAEGWSTRLEVGGGLGLECGEKDSTGSQGQAGGRRHFHDGWRLNLSLAPEFVLQLGWG